MDRSVSIEIPTSEKGIPLSDFLLRKGIFLPSPCGGRGVCKKCKVKVISGKFLSADDGLTPLLPDENGDILACRALCPREGGEIVVDQHVPTAELSIKAADYSGMVNAALDVGTTTLNMSFLTESGCILATFSSLNSQSAYGSDVISRISKSGKYLSEMQSCVLQTVKKAADEFCKVFDDTCFSELIVAGNTTMIHLFCGVSPEGMGSYPFTPAFTKRCEMTGRELGLPFEYVTLLPSASAFIGSDVICGAELCKMADMDEPSLLIDIGTNGEMILCTGKKRGNRPLAASAAAGPAMEGANISCGMGGISGAISRVQLVNGMIMFSTVDGGKPIGICGCGLIDLIACLLDLEIIDETGYIESAFTIENTPVSLTQKDVREFQLAKSAIRAGIDILLDTANLKPSDICSVYLAGGLGYYISVPSAVRTGLLPREFLSVTKAVGNTSLMGASECINESFKSLIDETANRIETVNLNDSPRFTSLFADYMMFLL